MILMMFIHSVRLTLRKAAGTAISSFSSTLLEGGVTPEEEDLIMWTSMNVSLGTSWSSVTLIPS